MDEGKVHFFNVHTFRIFYKLRRSFCVKLLVILTVLVLQNNNYKNTEVKNTIKNTC